MKADLLTMNGSPGYGGNTIDLSEASNTFTYHVGPYETVSVEMLTQGTAGIITLYRSNSPANNAFALETGTVTLGPGNAMSPAIDCTGFWYLHIKVTTVEAGLNATLTVIGKAAT